MTLRQFVFGIPQPQVAGGRDKNARRISRTFSSISVVRITASELYSVLCALVRLDVHMDNVVVLLQSHLSVLFILFACYINIFVWFNFFITLRWFCSFYRWDPFNYCFYSFLYIFDLVENQIVRHPFFSELTSPFWAGLCTIPSPPLFSNYPSSLEPP